MTISKSFPKDNITAESLQPTYIVFHSFSKCILCMCWAQILIVPDPGNTQQSRQNKTNEFTVT